MGSHNKKDFWTRVQAHVLSLSQRRVLDTYEGPSLVHTIFYPTHTIRKQILFNLPNLRVWDDFEFRTD